MHLTDDIDLNELVQRTGYSYTYFQRVFSCIAGTSIAEYIRKRRMTLAAMDLKKTDLRVIDIAVKYGYDSSDAFSRAFMSFHGITPTMARREDAKLKSFSPLRVQIQVEGKVETQYRLEKKGALRIVGVKKHFSAPKNNPSDVGVFWNEVFGSGVFDEIAALCSGEPYGVHGFMQVMDEEHVDYMIAAVTDQKVPEGMEEQIIPETTWAIFKQKGSVQDSMSEMWKQIFEEWLPSTEYEHAGTTEIECFCNSGDRRSTDFQYEIWIPVQRRKG